MDHGQEHSVAAATAASETNVLALVVYNPTTKSRRFKIHLVPSNHASAKTRRVPFSTMRETEILKNKSKQSRYGGNAMCNGDSSCCQKGITNDNPNIAFSLSLITTEWV